MRPFFLLTFQALGLTGVASVLIKLSGPAQGVPDHFDKGHQGCKHDYQGNCSEAKLEDENQHPCAHEKHEKRPQHQPPPGGRVSSAARVAIGVSMTF
jgi:hypothetical protein